MPGDNSTNLRLQLLCDRINQNLTSIEFYIKDDKEITRGSKDIMKIHLDDMQMCLDNFRTISGISPIELKGE